MSCSSCGATNAHGGRFCEQCGAALEITCANCGGPISADARFCRSCGTPVAQATLPAPAPAQAQDTQASPVAERRLVTVLFADLVGFTTLAEDRDPESTRELLTRYFDTARDAIEAHGGTIEKFIGDAVMAVWGTPVAHEDDAERAVRAALELVKEVPAIGSGLQARAGLLTGEAAVTLGATNQGMVAGDLVNTAARLQGVAEPGTVLVGESTMRAAERAIAFEEVGEHSLKGKLTPVPAWRAARIVAARGGQMRVDALEPPFVGREDELRLLKEQLHATTRDQRPRLVSILGPGGIGKSRLVWEFEKYLDGLTESIMWHRGRSPSYGDGITFWALGEMVRRRAGLTEEDDPDTTRQRIADTVAEHVPDPDERQIVEPALLTLLGVETSEATGRDRLFPAWRLFFERISERGTVALVFEDLHWADAGLLDFIDHLLDWSKSKPILVVTLARPELFDRRPDWGAGRRTFTALALDPLSDDAMRELLAGVVPGLPDAAVEAIVRRAEGIPLYAVETIRMLLAEGRIERDGDVFRPVGDLSKLSAPETLRALIGSRLDALDAADRSLLQDSSVLGQVFTAETLAVVTGTPEAELEPRLAGLARRELLEIEADPKSPERGQYRFVQALIQEVAYSTLALRDRRTRHLAVARHYESLGDEELAGALASHYVAAHEASSEGAEADAVAAQARIALRAAADRAATLGAHAQAVSHLDRALALTADATERAELLERAARSAHFAGSAEAERYVREAIDARRDSGDLDGMDRTTALLGEILIDRYELDDAIAVLEAALTDDRTREPLGEAELNVTLARAYLRVGRYDDCIRCAERALEIAEPNHFDRVTADALGYRAATIGRRGRFHEASALYESAIRLASAGGWADLELRLRNNLGVLLQEEDPPRVYEVNKHALELARRIGHTPNYVRAAASAAHALLYHDLDADAALALIEDALERAGDAPPYFLILTRVNILGMRGHPDSELLPQLERIEEDIHLRATVENRRAELSLMANDLEAARRHAQRARELDETGESELDALDRLIAVGAALGDIDAVRAAADAYRAAPTAGAFSEPSLLVATAVIAASEGRTGEATRLFNQAFGDLEGLGLPLGAAEWRLTALRVLPGVADAATWAADARAIFERVGAVAYLRQLDEAVARSSSGSASPRTPVQEPRSAGSSAG
jgi:class 3 adenylate cyclase/tetratricopeptide (TPR) repeat protein